LIIKKVIAKRPIVETNVIDQLIVPVTKKLINPDMNNKNITKRHDPFICFISIFID